MQRNIQRVIQSILGVLPDTGLADLRAELFAIRKAARFQPVEASTDLWAKLGAVLTARIPDVEKEPDWIENVSTIARGEC